MRFRLKIAAFLLGLSAAIRALVPLILRPKELMEANKRFAQSPAQIEYWGSDRWTKQGLLETEKGFLEKYSIKSGKFLVLGCGGGREAIALAKLGFKVVGVDFTDELVEVAKRNAGMEKVEATFQRQDIAELALAENSFDYAMLSSFLYSFIPVKKERIALLKNVKKLLHPGSKFLLTLNFSATNPKKNRLKHGLKKIIAFFTLGNIRYHDGDAVLEQSRTFSIVHNFGSQEELLDEIRQAGLETEEVNPKSDYAVLSVS